MIMKHTWGENHAQAKEWKTYFQGLACDELLFQRMELLVSYKTSKTMSTKFVRSRTFNLKKIM